MKYSATLLVTLLPSAIQAAAPSVKSDKPNIVFILADDLGYGDLGCYGQKLIETPHIDTLASRGIRFTQHYSGQAVSAPSRCCLLTGLHTKHAVVKGNEEMASRGDVWSHQAMLDNSYLEGQAPLPASTRTMAHLMQQAGYTTGMVGKWGLGYPGSVSTPNKMGFDFFYGYNCQRQSHGYYPMFLYRNETREYLDNAPLLVPHQQLPAGDDPLSPASYDKYRRKEYAGDLMFREITQFVTNNADTPFFFMWTTPLPHVALQAPQRWVDYYTKKFGDEKPYLGNSGYLPTRAPRATYAAMVSYLDEQVGLLIAQLKELGIYENTIIVFTSDNGPTFNTGGADSPFFNSAGTFNNQVGWVKASLREGGIRVPLIVSWERKIKEYRSSEHVSAFWDFMPTFAEVVGMKSPHSDGVSMINEWMGKPQTKHQYLYWEFPEGGGSKAVRMGKWKAYLPNTKKGNKQVYLYNLETDPREQIDLAADYPTIVKEMEAILFE